MSRPDLVTFGETMAVVTAQSTGPLQHNATFRMSCAGAESTVAIGMARLGHHAVWVGRTGDDEPGELVRSTLRGTGVEVLSPIDPTRPTGLMLRSTRAAQRNRVQYYRSDSAGSGLTAEDVAEALTQRPRVVHATGITSALSPQTHQTTLQALTSAKRDGAVISYDVNYRTRLASVTEAAQHVATMLDYIDIMFCGDDELPVLTAALGTTATLDELLDRDLSFELVVKRGSRGAAARTSHGANTTAALDVPVVDTIGAGDAFVAGYLSGHLDGLHLADRLSRGAQLGAFCVSTQGDWEGLPHRSDLDLLRHDPGHTER